jgi:hypothetical protein
MSTKYGEAINMKFLKARASKFAVVLLTLGIPLVVAGQSEIFKWTDKHGHVHYSDKAPQNEPAEQLELDAPNIMRSQSDELWNFEFDGREWALGHKAANQNSSIREYVLVGQSVEDWTELVTSQYMRTALSIEQYYDKFWRENPDCPSLEASKARETTETIIFQGKHGACGGYEPGEFIQRLSGIDGGILILTFAQKGQLTSENRSNWTRILSEANTKYLRPEEKLKAKSLPLSQLGPLPDNTVSKYLETLSTSVFGNPKQRSAGFSISLRARKGLPAGAYLEVHFPDPSDLDKKNIESKVLAAGETEAFFTSPENRDIKCWNYEVLVYIYRGDSKTKLLGTHRQVIQSRINYARIKDVRDYVRAARTGLCP